jgi:AcrR family transcriptional regulator
VRKDGILAPTDSRPLRADALRNRTALLEAAEIAFERRGTAASLEEIAQLAGVGIGTLYRHFPTRQDLVESLVRDRALDLIHYGEELVTSVDDPFTALEMWLTASVRHVMAYRGLAESMVEATCGDPDNPLASICTEQQHVVTQLLHRAQDMRLVRPEVTPDDISDLAAAIAWISERRPQRNPLPLIAIALEGIRASSLG